MISLIEYGETLIFFVLLIASITVFAVGLERTIIFRRNTAKDADNFLKDLTFMLRSHDLQGAFELIIRGRSHVYSRFAEFSLKV